MVGYCDKKYNVERCAGVIMYEGLGLGVLLFNTYIIALCQAYQVGTHIALASSMPFTLGARAIKKTHIRYDYPLTNNKKFLYLLVGGRTCLG